MVDTPQHTPGPWGWMPAEGICNNRSILQGWCGAKGQFHEGLNHTLDECGDLILACEAPYEDNPDAIDHTPSEANARLIAAAPDLLDACKSAVAAMRTPSQGRIAMVTSKCEAAIAKAVSEGAHT